MSSTTIIGSTSPARLGSDMTLRFLKFPLAAAFLMSVPVAQGHASGFVAPSASLPSVLRQKAAPDSLIIQVQMSDIVYGTEGFYLDGREVPTQPGPPPTMVPGLPNPNDKIIIGLPNLGAADDARATLRRVERASGQLTATTTACAQVGSDVKRYLSCITDALDDFAASLDQITSDLPPGMRNVARIVNRASADIKRLGADADRRLARATTDAEREQIRRDTLMAATRTMSGAAAEIRKSITLVRAEDPELAAIQRETVVTVADAADNVGIQLARAVGL